jgi:hypothetical protein
MLVGIALLAAPASFAVLPRIEAGRVNGLLFEREAYASLVLALRFVVLERARPPAAGGSVLGAQTLLALGALFLTVAGAFGVQPMLAATRSGDARFSLAQLHAASVALYGLKTLLVLTLAWRVSAPRPPSSSG